MAGGRVIFISGVHTDGGFVANGMCEAAYVWGAGDTAEAQSPDNLRYTLSYPPASRGKCSASGKAHGTRHAPRKRVKCDC